MIIYNKKNYRLRTGMFPDGGRAPWPKGLARGCFRPRGWILAILRWKNGFFGRFWPRKRGFLTVFRCFWPWKWCFWEFLGFFYYKKVFWGVKLAENGLFPAIWVVFKGFYGWKTAFWGVFHPKMVFLTLKSGVFDL
jgi:hypothetical protein